MRVWQDIDQGTCTLVAANGEEEAMLRELTMVISPGTKIEYGSRERDGDTDEYCKIFMYAGSREVEQRDRNVTRTVHVGGLKLTISGTTIEDKKAVGAIRDIGFFGTGGLILLSSLEVNGEFGIITTGGYCKYCQAWMIDLASCEWMVCNACARHCGHTYTLGVVHGANELGEGLYCTRCGRGKPKTENERQPSLLEQHLALERKGLIIQYEGGPVSTPTELLKLTRLTRKLEKARKRMTSVLSE